MDKAKTKKIVGIVLNVVLWLFLIFAAMMTVFAIAASSNADSVPQIGGKVFLSVQSDSMSPTFKKGDMIVGKIVSASDLAELKADDVITFRMDLDGDGTEELNTHRIVKVQDEGNGTVIFTTKGDNNAVEDTYNVYVSDVVAVWTGTRIAGLGAVISFMQQPTGFLLVIVLPLAVLFIYQIVVLVRAILKVKNEGKRQITAADEELIKQRAVEEYLRQQAEKNAAGQSAGGQPSDDSDSADSDSADSDSADSGK